MKGSVVSIVHTNGKTRKVYTRWRHAEYGICFNGAREIQFVTRRSMQIVIFILLLTHCD